MIMYKLHLSIFLAIDSVLIRICDFKVELISANDFFSDNSIDYVVNSYLENYQPNDCFNFKLREQNMGMIGNFILSNVQFIKKYITH